MSKTTNHFNAEGLNAYPTAVKNLPFCCWRIETVNGRKTKVPYNPKTGKKSHVDNDSTFTDYQSAMNSVTRSKYLSGIGVKASGNVGFIDIDGCLEYGTLSELASQVLNMLPGAFAEKSPSGTGLHLMFLLPEDFSFDKSRYYINNRSVHMEFYIPGSTNRFLTVTGNVYRSGDMNVTAKQLYAVLDRFMQRTETVLAPSIVPEGGSILTDAEVMKKAAEAENRDRFMQLYLGNWEEYFAADANAHTDRSHSEADLALCHTLAFYCRGDMEQMDRLFRKSGLMRDKWDRPQSGSTYGILTMKKAISGCTSFYGLEDKAAAAEDFNDISADNQNSFLPVCVDSCDTADDGTDDDTSDETDTDCIAETNRRMIDSYLSNPPISVETALSENFLSLAAWAAQNDLLYYTRMRDAVPKNIGMRNFEREVRKRQQALNAAVHSSTLALLSLKGINTPGMLVPEGWNVDSHGITHLEMMFGELRPVPISAEPLFVSAKLVNVDDGTEKLEITFRRNGKYKKLIAPRADMLNKNAVIKYADDGIPVSSNNAGKLTHFIYEFEAINSKAIPIRRSIRRAGWIGNEFYPYSLKNGIAAQTDGSETERILAALESSGSEEAWMSLAATLRTMPFARALLAASFASPLLEKLQHRVIYFHIWYSSKSGKTAALKFAISVWGDPKVLVSKYFSTIVGMERWAGTLKHLPYAMDELQTLNQKRLSVNDIVYTLGNGSGKTRGRVGSGLQKVETWRNCILSTGEQPMTTDSSMDGVNTRLMEIYAAPLTTELNSSSSSDMPLTSSEAENSTIVNPLTSEFVSLMDEDDENCSGTKVDNDNGIGSKDATAVNDTDTFAQQLHQVSEENYGFAGEKFIRFVVGKLENDDNGNGNPIKADYKRIRAEFNSTNIHTDDVAVLALADYYASMAVFNVEESVAFEEAIMLGNQLLGNLEANKPQDSIESAWQYVCGWVSSNKPHFENGEALYQPTPTFGKVTDTQVYAIVGDLNEALENAGFSARKCIKGFQERGYIESFPDATGIKRSQIGRRIKGVLVRVYVLNLKVEKDKSHVVSSADDADDADSEFDIF
ncbi:MAG: DUF927 domain-containing protein [Ruminococcus sp.]|nr:DUF927 domain-containing protein [Ruminococcus sp.]